MHHKKLRRVQWDLIGLRLLVCTEFSPKWSMKLCPCPSDFDPSVYTGNTYTSSIHAHTYISSTYYTHIHVLYTQSHVYTYILHTIYTLYISYTYHTYTIHILYTLNAHMLHLFYIPYIHYTHPLYTICTHVTSLLHTIHYTHPLYIIWYKTCNVYIHCTDTHNHSHIKYAAKYQCVRVCIYNDIDTVIPHIHVGGHTEVMQTHQNDVLG